MPANGRRALTQRLKGQINLGSQYSKIYRQVSNNVHGKGQADSNKIYNIL
jgi:hypothetical protein